MASLRMLIIGTVAVVLLVVVFSVVATSSSSSSNSIVVNGKTVTTKPGFVPTTMAPTTMAPTTMAPTTMAPTTTPPPTLVSLVSIEKKDNNASIINLAEIKIYDENGTLIPNSNLSALLSPAFDNAKNFPASNLIDGNMNNFAHTNFDYKLVGGSVNAGGGQLVGKAVQFVSYVPQIDDWVFMVIDDGYLKMVNLKNTVAKYTSANGETDPTKVFNANSWNSYNQSSVSADGIQAGYRVISNVPTATPFSNTNMYNKQFSAYENRAGIIDTTSADYQQGFGSGASMASASTDIGFASASFDSNVKVSSRDFAVGLRDTLTTGLQFIQVKLNPPSRVSKIEIFNRTDCCQDRINNTVVKTLNPNNRVVSVCLLRGSNMKHTINYDSKNGVISTYTSA